MSQRKHLDTLLEIKENPSTNQRSLAHKLNISLGLTNAIMQNLIHRGWIKAKKLTGRKLIYLVTPQGMSRVTHLVYDRFRETQSYYQYTKNILTAHLTKIYNQGEREVVIYGTNQLAEITYLSILDSSLKLHSILREESSCKDKFLSHKTISAENFLSQYSNNNSLSKQKIIILSTINSEELNKKLEKYKSIKNHIKIINIENLLTQSK